MKKILMIIITILLFINNVDANYKQDIVKILKSEIKDTKIKWLNQSYCDKKRIGAEFITEYKNKDGFYIPGQKQNLVLINSYLGICKGEWKRITRKQKINLLMHELLGHAFYHKRLNESEKNIFKKLNRQSKENDFIREYGKVNHYEDYATISENLYFTYNKKYKSKILNKKIYFIKKLITKYAR